uniref:Trypsin-like serine and cysteine n=1 Tax=Tetraselmis sp. GSL018 TaxID=582737 RepID=A0A061SDM3_9CHLO|eukprot:CAMPEP_0177587690 /NCGR_PEP_ID=MMETSP0419_2-20121207/5797_1 /TAXON_ID=582737 /ORGANISM="Tetraselmis sp., Strain GSL018" /LENGTH=441 /DNA_ID=CAMNT_0019077779 /DNA_START=100 /DNA_END=1425 /DNA_ORIENTATION=-
MYCESSRPSYFAVAILCTVIVEVSGNILVQNSGRRSLQFVSTNTDFRLSGIAEDSVVGLLAQALLRRQRRIGEFVLGGVPASATRYPYFVSLRQPRSETHFCGGVLVTRTKVLTAAHCVDQRLGEPLPIVHVGRNCLNCPTAAFKASAVASEVHPQWTGNFLDGNDVAIVTLDDSIEVPFPSIATSDTVLANRQLLQVVGFGYHNHFEVLSELLQVGTVEYIPNDECGRMFQQVINRNFLTGTMMCAFNHTTDACRGDSGGPLIIPSPTGDPSGDVVVGVVSLGMGGCRPDGTPAVYTDFVKVLQFLQAHLLMQPRVSLPPTGCQEKYELNWLFGVCPYGLQDWRATGEPLVAALISQSGIATGNSVEVGSDWGFSLANCGCPIYARVFVKIRLGSRDQADRMWLFIADDRNILSRIRNSMRSVTCASGLQLSGRLVRENC